VGQHIAHLVELIARAARLAPEIGAGSSFCFACSMPARGHIP
jgi:hypothetical protein